MVAKLKVSVSNCRDRVRKQVCLHATDVHCDLSDSCTFRACAEDVHFAVAVPCVWYVGSPIASFLEKFKIPCAVVAKNSGMNLWACTTNRLDLHTLRNHPVQEQVWRSQDNLPALGHVAHCAAMGAWFIFFDGDCTCTSSTECGVQSHLYSVPATAHSW